MAEIAGAQGKGERLAGAERLRSRILQAALERVGFWRAQLDMNLLIGAVLLFCYPLFHRIPSPWGELIDYTGLFAYAFAAWRLGPGTGGLLRRAGRVLLWLLIFGQIQGVFGWALLTFLPWELSFLGVSIAESQFSPGTYFVIVPFLVGSLFLPTRLLIVLWEMGRSRLRWQLTFSYLLIGILTNFFVPLALLAYVALISLAAVPPIVSPLKAASHLAAALSDTVAGGVAPGELDPLLSGLLDGSTWLPLAPDESTSDLSDLYGSGVRRLILLRPDGVVLAAAGLEAPRSGEPIPVQLRNDLRLLIDRALAGDTCVEGNPAKGPLPDTAICPVGAADQAPAAVLVVGSSIDGAAQLGAALGRVVTLTLLGTSVILNVAILVVIAIVPIALGVGYLLARRLTRRIERLDLAAGAVAAGRLDQLVPIDTQDEIGRLGETFNGMAARLAEREQALAAAAARSDALLHANKRLVADVSHELRNPLATLRAYLETLELEHGGELPEHDMQVIQAEMQRLTGLVDDLFTLARIEARQLPLSLSPVEAGPLMRRIADTLAPIAHREREIELIAHIPPGLPAVAADPARLEQVLRNLAQNALRHTPPGGIVAFEARDEGAAGVALVVADTGVGIEPADLPHVFERFYRGDSSRARETGGAGLGLSLVHELVTAMGGEVSVESTPGRGSRFTVRLRRA